MSSTATGLRPIARAVPDPVRVGHDAARGRFWVGAVVGTGVALTVGLLWDQIEVAIAFGALTGVFAWIVDGWSVASRTIRVETQLADALDLLGSSVSAGVGLVEAMQGVVRDVRQPLRGVMAAAAERLRLGDDPQRVFEEAQRTLPLSAFRLLTHYLSVQWQSGGAMAPGLHAIAETVRDRVNLARRIHSQSAEARFSVLGILAVVYFIAILAWTNSPERVEDFVLSEIGGGIVAGCVFLQAIGLVWMARLTRIEL